MSEERKGIAQPGKEGIESDACCRHRKGLGWFCLELILEILFIKSEFTKSEMQAKLKKKEQNGTNLISPEKVCNTALIHEPTEHDLLKLCLRESQTSGIETKICFCVLCAWRTKCIHINVIASPVIGLIEITYGGLRKWFCFPNKQCYVITFQ